MSDQERHDERIAGAALKRAVGRVVARARAWGKAAYSFGHEVADGLDRADGLRMAAALAFYTVFSLPAVLALLLTAARALSLHAVRTGLVSSVVDAIGPAGGDVIKTMAKLSELDTSGGVISTLVSFGVLLYGATRAFSELQAALNRMWEVELRRGAAYNFLWKRLVSFGVIIGIGLLVVTSLVVEWVLASVGAVLSGATGIASLHRLTEIATDVLGFVMITGTFALLYRIVPDAYVEWRDAGVGATVAALLFAIGKWLFGLYMAHSDVTSAFGAAGALAAVLLWTHYFAFILLVGAETAQVWARRKDRVIRPSRGAVTLGAAGSDDGERADAAHT